MDSSPSKVNKGVFFDQTKQNNKNSFLDKSCLLKLREISQILQGNKGNQTKLECLILRIKHDLDAFDADMPLKCA